MSDEDYEVYKEYFEMYTMECMGSQLILKYSLNIFCKTNI